MHEPRKSRLKDRIANRLGYERKQAPEPDFEPEFRALFESVREFTMTSTERVHALCQAIKYVVDAGIEGAIVECGVWRGGSMMAAAKTLLNSGDDGRDLYLFDTFEGMTAPTDSDVSLDGRSATEQLEETREKLTSASVWAYSSLEAVRQAMQSTAYPEARVHFIKGPVEENLPGEAPERIAVLRLDTDWYESTYHELVHLYPRLAVGGVLIIDDYGHWKGARKAVDQYIQEHRLRLLLHRIDYSGRIAVKLDP